MSIELACPSCKKSLVVRDDHAGKRGRCKHCKTIIQIPARLSDRPPSEPQRTAPANGQRISTMSAAQVSRAILGGFGKPIRKVRTPLVYRFAALWVAGMMLLLPVVYLGLIALLGYGVYFHATHNISLLKNFRPVRLAAFVYLTPIAIGVIGIMFMIKPLFAPLPRRDSRRTLVPSAEPLLFAFVQKVCQAIHAPPPQRIDIDCRVNASAHLARGILPNFMNQLVLTIGLPLVATMSVGQFAGILAHEFGHFAQGAGMRLSYVILSINAWFYRVVYERDAWDETLVAWSEDEHWMFSLAFQFARFMVWLSRRILWMLMLLAHAISCFLDRQQEYDADRRATRLIGSEANAELMTNFDAVDLAAGYVTSQLGESLRSSSLCEDYPSLVNAYAKCLPNDLRQAIRKASDEQTTGWFDTHPATRDRVAEIRRENSPGVFRCDHSATVLFRDFGALARARTLDYYRDVLHTRIPREKLIPLSNIVRSTEHTEPIAP